MFDCLTGSIEGFNSLAIKLRMLQLVETVSEHIGPEDPMNAQIDSLVHEFVLESTLHADIIPSYAIYRPLLSLQAVLAKAAYDKGQQPMLKKLFLLTVYGSSIFTLFSCVPFTESTVTVALSDVKRI
jgi:hypothetical protein